VCCGMLEIILAGIFAIIGAIVGSIITYYTQKRTQERTWKRRIKREDAITMRAKVYGPIFKMMSEILESMEQVKRPDWEITNKLEEMRTQYLFYNMRRDLKNKFYTLVERLDKYETVYSATQTLVLRKIKEAVKKSHRMDVSVGESQVRLGLEILKDAIEVGSITLEQAILQEIRPSDFIRTKKEVWEDVIIDVRIGGQRKNIGDFESLYEDVLREIEGELLYRKEKKQRKALVEELEAFLDQIKTFVTVQ